jgi:hypothetical protein
MLVPHPFWRIYCKQRSFEIHKKTLHIKDVEGVIILD